MPQILLSVTLTQGVLTLSLIIWHEIFFSRLIWIDRNNVKSYVNRNIIWNITNSSLATQEINSKINYLLTPSTFLQLRNLQDIMRMFIIPIMQFRSLFVIVKISGKEYFWNQSRYFTKLPMHKNMMSIDFYFFPIIETRTKTYVPYTNNLDNLMFLPLHLSV